MAAPTERSFVLSTTDAPYSVALSADGSVMAVGLADYGATNYGGVLVFDWSGSAWVQRGSIIVAVDPGMILSYSYFGWSVALSADGSVLVVGAPEWSADIVNSRFGAVFVFDWNGSAWSQRARLEPSDRVGDYLPAYDRRFGSSVAISDAGTFLAVGAERWDGSFGDQGGVYQFDWSGSAWLQNGTVIVAGSPGQSYEFGASLAMSSTGAVIVVGSKVCDGGANGGVYTFDRAGGAVTQRSAPMTDGVWGYGYAVALSGDGSALAVGNPYKTITASYQGALYLYDVSGSAWALRGDALVADPPTSYGYFGAGVSFSDAATIFAVVEKFALKVRTYDVAASFRAFWTNLFGQREEA